MMMNRAHFAATSSFALLLVVMAAAGSAFAASSQVIGATTATQELTAATSETTAFIAVRMNAYDTASTQAAYAQVRAEVTDASAGTHSGALNLAVADNGSMKDIMRISASGVALNQGALSVGSGAAQIFQANATTITVNGGKSNVDYIHYADGGTPALFVAGADGRVTLGSNNDTGTFHGLKMVANDSVCPDGYRQLMLDSYNNTYPWGFGSLIFRVASGTESNPSDILPMWNCPGWIIFQGFCNGGYVESSRIEPLMYYDAQNDCPIGALRFWIRNDQEFFYNLQLSANHSIYIINTAESEDNPLECANGAYLSYDGQWESASSRERKLSISNTDSKAEWDLLDSITPVSFEYRKTLLRWRLKDGRVVASLNAEAPAKIAEIKSRMQTGGAAARAVAKLSEKDIKDLAEKELQTSSEQITILSDEGTGIRRRGFIAEDMPGNLAQGKAISAVEICSLNTAALKEAKRHIQDAEGRLSAVEKSASAAAALQASLDDLRTRIAAVESEAEYLRFCVENDCIEIAAEQALETVDEVTTSIASQTVTKYRINLSTGKVESYQTIVPVITETKTGAKVLRLKSGVSFDDNTGKFYQKCAKKGL
ncbi:MAG: hypothetical protein NTX50_14265 [Candidatus Sumerlaeota bacterium]|nr:hypothetical protein [Candidatus Sumerlaeota bacterium]